MKIQNPGILNCLSSFSFTCLVSPEHCSRFLEESSFRMLITSSSLAVHLSCVFLDCEHSNVIRTLRGRISHNPTVTCINNTTCLPLDSFSLMNHVSLKNSTEDSCFTQTAMVMRSHPDVKLHPNFAHIILH